MNVLLWTLKPADDSINEGVNIRVWNLSPLPVSFSLSLSTYSILGNPKQLIMCKGDFDADGDVNGSDLVIFATGFGRTNRIKNFS